MKKILVGITGSIAAYKAAYVVSLLKKRGYDITVVMTKSATEFITPITFETLTENKVYTDLFLDDDHTKVNHIKIAKEVDAILVVPATYNIIGKVANGLADDMLSTIISATKKPVYYALAMNTNMYQNDILKRNIDLLLLKDHQFIEPTSGLLACGDEGLGKLENEEVIVDFVDNDLFGEKPLKGKNVLISGGPTRVYIDPIRYITNTSSGKMGWSLALAAKKMGANVTLVIGPNNLSPISGVNIKDVETPSEMLDAMLESYNDSDIVIMSAAVSDYKPKEQLDKKMKKKDGDLSLELERTTDILKELGKRKRNQILVGFAAESEELLKNGQKKLEKKNLDFICINNLNYFNKSSNEITILSKEGKSETLKGLKLLLANEILKRI